ncbi:MAG: hypothetical protein D6828_03745, partial [Nitrospirae bacterium]
YEETAGRHGILSGALIEGLNPTTRPDGIVTNYSLTDVVSRHLRYSLQKPVFSNTGGEIILTRAKIHVEKEPSISIQKKCPYKGLQYFDFNEEDPKYFYGREALIDELIEKVRRSNFLAVMGASGSGKSSVVRAGLLHQLKIGKRLAGSDQWSIHIFHPDENPLSNLAMAFVDQSLSNIDKAVQLKKAQALIDSGVDGFKALIKTTAGEGKVVLFIDQFEEVFTLCDKEEDRRKFFKILLETLPASEDKLCLVIAMRADFFNKCAEDEYSGLSRYIQDNLITVTPMSKDELRRAITEPAKKVGLEIEHELVEQMVEDVHGSPGSLPLLQYTLTELWQRSKGNTLTLSDYHTIGGVKGALSKRADEIYNALGPEEQNAARRIFIELTQLGEGTEDTRRRVPKEALITPKYPEDLLDSVIRKLSDANLIVTDELVVKGAELERIPVVDVAHEALIRHWPRLRRWLDENREQIRFKRKLDDAAKDWDNQGRPQGLLWRSPNLERLQEYYKEHSEEMTALELDFYRTSLEAKEKAKRRKLVGIVIFICLIALFGIYQYVNKQKIEEQRDKAHFLLAKNYWFNAVAEKKANNLIRAFHFIARSAKEEINPSILKNRIFNLQNSNSVFLVNVMKHDSLVFGALFNRDETRILSWSWDGTVRLWDAKDGSLIATMKHDAKVFGALFNRDETRILSWSGDFFRFRNRGEVRLWDTKDGSLIATMKHDDSVNGALFNRDETRI